MYIIKIKNIRNEEIAEAIFATKEMCLAWYDGYIYNLNPKNNEKDFYPFSITKKEA